MREETYREKDTQQWLYIESFPQRHPVSDSQNKHTAQQSHPSFNRLSTGLPWILFARLFVTSKKPAHGRHQPAFFVSIKLLVC